MALPTRVRTGVKAFIVHEGKILVIHERVKREDKPDEILFDVPGGGIEGSETLEETLHREVFEEVGLKIEIERPVGGWEHFYNKKDEQVHIVCVAFQCRLKGSAEIDTTKNPAAEDIFETQWLTKEQLMNDPEVLDIEDMRKSVANVMM